MAMCYVLYVVDLEGFYDLVPYEVLSIYTFCATEIKVNN